MYYVISWTKDNFTRLVFTCSSEDIVVRYAIMRENQGYDVSIDTCREDEFHRRRLDA